MITKTTRFNTPWTICIFFFLMIHPLIPARADAALYAFGDSAIDTGNVFRMTSQLKIQGLYAALGSPTIPETDKTGALKVRGSV